MAYMLINFKGFVFVSSIALYSSNGICNINVE